MGIVDAHHHLWDLDAVDYPWLNGKAARFFGDPAPISKLHSLPEFRAAHGRYQVVAWVHIQVGATDTLAETRWLAEVSDAQKWPMAIVAAANLCAPDLEDRLDRLSAAAGSALSGVRQIVARHPSEDGSEAGALLADPAFETGLRHLAARGLSFDLQLTAPLLLRAADLFGRNPGLRVVLCHCGSPWDPAEDAMANWADALARFALAVPGSMVKLSGLGMLRRDSRGVPAIATGTLAAFGPARTMWGSNWPVDMLHRAGWEAILAEAQALVPAADHASVFGGIAKDFYRIKP